MGADRFRAQVARMDALLVKRLGDRVTLADGREVWGDFLNPFLGADIAQGAARLSKVVDTDEVRETTFTGRVEDLPGLKKDDVLTVELPPALGGGTYKVVRLKPDGTGLLIVSLGTNHARTDDIT